VDLGGVILFAAGLSFVGLGLELPAADWGVMVAAGRVHLLSGYWWVAGFPGLAMTLTALAFALVGDALREPSV
jgi:peptide/nickel transport system permease protein